MISDKLKQDALDFLSAVEAVAKDEGYQAAKMEFDAETPLFDEPEAEPSDGDGDGGDNTPSDGEGNDAEGNDTEGAGT